MRWGTLLFVLAACSIHGEAELLASSCGEDCPVCDADADCVIAHNPCTARAVCGHVDEDLAVVQIGCDAALEYDTPDASACVCEADVCSVVDE